MCVWGRGEWSLRPLFTNFCPFTSFFTHSPQNNAQLLAQKGKKMTNTLRLKPETTTNLHHELRNDVLPTIFQYIDDMASETFLQSDVPVDLTGLTNYAEIESALALHKEKSILHISDILKQTLAEMLIDSRATSTPPTPLTEQKESVVDKAEREDPELLNEPREFEPGPTAPEQESSPAMPICTIRQIIKDRVDDEMITDIVFLAAEPDQFTPAQIRKKGVKLDEQIIQVIIDDNEHRINGVIAACARFHKMTTDDDPEMTDDEINAQPLNDYTIREIKRMYKKGHTIEYITSETELSTTEVLEVTDEIDPDSIEPSLTTVAMIKGMKENGNDLDKIAEICKIRPEIVQSLNGSQ